MKAMQYTLITDGRTDRHTFLSTIDWLFKDLKVSTPFQGKWANLEFLRRPPKSLAERITATLEYYPCDLLFIHRDAEKESVESRKREIEKAASRTKVGVPPKVCIIPIRMQEAWLLFDEDAIRCAAGHPSGRSMLHLPPLQRVEGEPDPKKVLYEALTEACGLNRRRVRAFPVAKQANLVASYIQDFSPLRALSAFRAFEEDLTHILREMALFPS